SRGLLRVAELDGEHDQIDLTHLRGILEDPHRLEVRVAQLAFDAQAVLAHRLAVRAAGDEGDLVPGLGQAAAVVASYPAAAHHGDLHLSGRRCSTAAAR